MAPKSGDGSSARPADEAQPKVKAACEACRTRKIKCDGVRPVCTSCQKKIKDCVYITEPDELRVTALKRRFVELSNTSSNNEALIRLLRDTADDEAQVILERIRADESISSILTAGDDGRAHGSATNSLILAIEGANAHRSGETSSSEASDPQLQQPSTPTEPPTGLIDKQSISFLVDQTQQTRAAENSGASSSTSAESSIQERRGSTRTAAEPHDEAEAIHRVGNASKQTAVSHPSPTRSQRSAEKRTRLFDPTRPGLQARPTWSTPATFRPKPASSVNLLATRARSTDTSWKRRLGGVKATDWEVYYTDDHTLLEILKCYFVWENPTFGFVEEEPFWEGLIVGGSEFCNRALVHAIVAFGAKMFSLFSPEKPASIGHRAMYEITKLWDWDSDAAVPANMSAGLLLYATLESNGQDKDGAPYISGAVNLASDSGLFSSDRSPQTYPSSDSQLAKHRAILAWNLYSYQGHSPPVGPPVIEKEEDSKNWSPYPLQMPPRPGLMSSHRSARAMMWKTASKILPLHQRHRDGSNRDLHWINALELFEELQSRRKDLNGRLGMLHGAPPHVFTLHVIELFKPFVAADNEPQAQIKFKPAHDHTEQARLQLRLLVHQMELELPDLPFSLYYLTTSVMFVANDTLMALKGKPDVSDESFYFCLCLQLMRRMANAYPLARYLIIGFQQVARRIGVELPSQAAAIVKSLGPVTQPTLTPSSELFVQLDLAATDPELSTLQRLNEEFHEIADQRVRWQEEKVIDSGPGGERGGSR
ncbi:hypothetical protein M409DRAFT_52093 [Zasmidium cellare ATCC 36951]|uniref:Zn(2)-C6 fungal-type domain-containing protein n=1 Tax=Zasmidium cellare ATCC 36951 TaxID=1080233 RepID=A0A6A6CUS5_ZASCE|nr:uncharacterized protein M409DRAFT_52093 [Zasmidium cellare ATCC 36951]KAF2169559.1 hypothetical protein M409DRAFT_52093 [Zasmidium cellare ATCC 36951]